MGGRKAGKNMQTLLSYSTVQVSQHLNIAQIFSFHISQISSFFLLISLSIYPSLSVSLSLSISLSLYLSTSLSISRHHKTSQLIFLHIIFLTNGKIIFYYFFCLNSLILTLFFLSISPFLYFFLSFYL